MRILDVLTILSTGLMIGNELCVSLFVNPAIWQLDDGAQKKALSLLARSLGRVMPIWYASCLVLLSVETYVRRHEPDPGLLLSAVVIWIAVIIFTIFALVPINNRIAGLTTGSADGSWREEHKRWDTLHRGRVLLLIAAMVCMMSAILA